MDFELTDLQRDLAEGIRRLCQGRFSLDKVRAYELAERVVDREGWTALADAGVFGLRLDEDAGGAGAGLAEAAVIFEELGRALVPGPLVCTHLAAAVVTGSADGTTVVGAIERPEAGTAAPVIIEDLGDLDVLLVISEDGIASVEPSSLDATRLARPMDPLTPVWAAADLPLGEPIAGPETAALWRRDGSILTAALQIGAASWSTELAVEYAKNRQQFGRSIGGFQAVKHLCADMVVRTEVARAAVHAAAVTVDQPEVGDPQVAAAGAKLLANEAAVTNGRSCIQVHGGMGFTWEVPAHLAYKRARVLATQFGTDGQLAESLAAACS